MVNILCRICNSYKFKFKSNLADIEVGAIYSEKGVNADYWLFEYNKASGGIIFKCHGGKYTIKVNHLLQIKYLIIIYAFNIGGAILCGSNLYIIMKKMVVQYTLKVN